MLHGERKKRRPGIAPNDNTTHVPTAGSSAALTKPNHTPTRHPAQKSVTRRKQHRPGIAPRKRVTCVVCDVIQRVATGETTAYGTVELDVYGTVEQCTGE